MGLAERVVLELVNDGRLDNMGYIIVTDNFNSRPKLFRALVEKGFGTCGTARKNMKGIPPCVGKAILQKGDVISSVGDGILSLKWKDKKDVLMLSTSHDTSMVTKSRRSRRAEGGVEEIDRGPQPENGRCGQE